MEIEISTWLYDISRSIDEIDSFFLDIPKSYSTFQNDVKTRRAIERNLEIIGEALNRILTKQPEIKITNSRRIVDTRNRIIHGYDNVSDEIIWSIVVKYLPILKNEIQLLLSKR